MRSQPDRFAIGHLPGISPSWMGYSLWRPPPWRAVAGLWHRELSSELPNYFLSSLSTAIRSRVAGWAMSAIVPATLGWLALRSRLPRPRLRQLSRRPGAVACGVAGLMLIVHAAYLPVSLRTMGGLPSPFLVAAWHWPDSMARVSSLHGCSCC